MCLALISPNPDKRPDMDGLKRAFDANNGGAGFAYLRQRRVVVRKGFMRYDAFAEAYTSALRRAHGPMLVHFRIPTHGSEAASMTHPFRLSKVGAALIHNGMIPGAEDKKRPHLSDTAIFCERVAGYSAERFRIEKKKLEARIGWSRIAVLYPDGDIVTLGDGWHTNETDGCTYSNYSYKPTATRWEADPRLWAWMDDGGPARGKRSRRWWKDEKPRAPATYRPAPLEGLDRSYQRRPAAPIQSIGRAGRMPGPVTTYRIDPASGLLQPDPPRVRVTGRVCDWCRTPGGMCDPDGTGALCDERGGYDS